MSTTLKAALTGEGSDPYSNAAAAAIAVEALSGAQLLDIARGDAAKASVLLTPAGITVHDIKPLLDKYLTAPERRKGTATVMDIDSLIGLALRFRMAGSAIFADPNRTAPKLTVVFNYSPMSGDGTKADFGDHRAVYNCPLSDEWKAWAAKDSKWMSQTEFAAFIDDRIGDLAVVPPDDKGINALLDLVGGSLASPSTLLGLSRSLTVSVNTQVKEAVTLATGEISVQYTESHTNGAGAPITVPNLFALTIPVFYAGVPYLVPVRLRYKLAEQRLTWSYNLYRPDLTFDHAFTEIVDKAREATEMPVYVGAPEAQ